MNEQQALILIDLMARNNELLVEIAAELKESKKLLKVLESAALTV